jgi:hypothetical protein
MGGLYANTDYTIIFATERDEVINTQIKTDMHGVLTYQTNLKAPQTRYVVNIKKEAD